MILFLMFAGMRILVMLLLDTLPMLGNVLLLCFFVFFIFGIVGVQLWEGILRQRCELVLPPNILRPKYVVFITHAHSLTGQKEATFIISHIFPGT